MSDVPMVVIDDGAELNLNWLGFAVSVLDVCMLGSFVDVYGMNPDSFFSGILGANEYSITVIFPKDNSMLYASPAAVRISAICC